MRRSALRTTAKASPPKSDAAGAEKKRAGKEGISANASRGTNDWVLTSHQLSSKLRKACANIILNENRATVRKQKG